MKDKRAYEIKRKLYKAFGKHKVKVRINKYTAGESIDIYTELIKNVDELFRLRNKLRVEGYLTEEEHNRFIELEEIEKRNKEMEKRIMQVLKDYYHIRYDRFGEILEGGNTYLFVWDYERA